MEASENGTDMESDTWSDCRVHRNRTSWIKNILLGIVGGFVGGLVFRLVGMTVHGTIANLIVSIAGACICIWLGRIFFSQGKVSK